MFSIYGLYLQACCLLMFLFPDTNHYTLSVQWSLIYSLPWEQHQKWKKEKGTSCKNKSTCSISTTPLSLSHTVRICGNSLAGHWFMEHCCQCIISIWGLFIMALQAERKESVVRIVVQDQRSPKEGGKRKEGRHSKQTFSKWWRQHH